LVVRDLDGIKLDLMRRGFQRMLGRPDCVCRSNVSCVAKPFGTK